MQWSAKHRFYQRLLVVLLALLCIVPLTMKRAGGVEAKKATSSSDDALLTLATEAYIYAYPLIMMDMTRQVMTNVPLPIGMRAPINQFAHARDLPNATFKDVTSPNEDMLYSGAWLDLSKQPYVLILPTMKNRYYLMAIADSWSNIFADLSSGKRNADIQKYAIIGPDWKGKIPPEFKQIHAPTNMVWVVGHIYCNGNPEDYMKVRRDQDEFILMPLSDYGMFSVAPGKQRINLNVDMQTPINEQVNSLNAEDYFNLLAAVMKANPPLLPYDKEIISKLASLGIEPGKPFHFKEQPITIQEALQKAVKVGQHKIKTQAASAGTYKQGWLYSLKTGHYEKNYLQRAFMSTVSLGAYGSQDVVYMRASTDQMGAPLNGKNRYILHFSKDALPPVKGFWSITLYDDNLLFADNPINRYNRTSKDKLKYNEDGSLDIYIQQAVPDKDKEANWLPAPDANFMLLMRLYSPEEAIIKKEWAPPPVLKNGDNT